MAQTVSVSSEEFRTKWGPTLDIAQTGGSVVIERFGRPIAVLVNYEDWRTQSEWRRAQADQHFAGMRDGVFLTNQELAILLRARSIAERNEPTVSHEALKQRVVEAMGNAAS